jgi:hypothetical protein
MVKLQEAENYQLRGLRSAAICSNLLIPAIDTHCALLGARPDYRSLRVQPMRNAGFAERHTLCYTQFSPLYVAPSARGSAADRLHLLGGFEKTIGGADECPLGAHLLEAA